jgi:hypothetical protein
MSKEIMINRTIKAIKADAGRRMKMGYFCSSNKKICDTTFCLAGWMVVSQPKFTYKGLVKEFSAKTGYQYLTWYEASNEGLDGFIGIKADEIMACYGFGKANKLFHLVMNDREDKKLRSFAKKVGIECEDKDALTVFDALPQQVRMDAAVRVLEILRDTEEVKWFDAIKYAVNKHLKTRA